MTYDVHTTKFCYFYISSKHQKNENLRLFAMFLGALNRIAQLGSETLNKKNDATKEN